MGLDTEEGSVVRSAVCGSGVVEFAGLFRRVVRRSREPPVSSNEALEANDPPSLDRSVGRMTGTGCQLTSHVGVPLRLD